MLHFFPSSTSIYYRHHVSKYLYDAEIVLFQSKIETSALFEILNHGMNLIPLFEGRYLEAKWMNSNWSCFLYKLVDRCMLSFELSSLRSLSGKQAIRDICKFKRNLVSSPTHSTRNQRSIHPPFIHFWTFLEPCIVQRRRKQGEAHLLCEPYLERDQTLVFSSREVDLQPSHGSQQTPGLFPSSPYSSNDELLRNVL